MDPIMRDMGKSSNTKKKKDDDVLGIVDSPKDGTLSGINGIGETKGPLDADPYEWEDESESTWNQDQKRQVRNKTEKKRKEKIRGFINDLAEHLPADRSIPKRQQCMNLILERTVEYMTFLKRQNQDLLLEKGDREQAEEIKRLRAEIQEITIERDKYHKRLEEKGGLSEPDPSELWNYRKEYSHQINPDNIDLTKLIKGMHKKSNDENTPEHISGGKEGKNRGKRQKKTVKSHLAVERLEAQQTNASEIEGHVLNLVDISNNDKPEDLSLAHTKLTQTQNKELSITTENAPSPEAHIPNSISETEPSSAVSDNMPVQSEQPDILAMSLSGQLTPNSIGPSFGQPMEVMSEAENPLQTLASVASNTQNLTSAVHTLGVNSVLPQYSQPNMQMTQSLNIPIMSTEQKGLNTSGQGLMMPQQTMPMHGLPNPAGGMFVMNQHGQLILVNDPSQGIMDPSSAGVLPAPNIPGVQPVPNVLGAQPGTNVPGVQPFTNIPAAPPPAKTKKTSKTKRVDNDGSSTTVVSGTGLIMSTQVTTPAVSTPSVTTPQPDGTMTFADQNAYTQQILANGGAPQMIPLSNGQMGILAPNQLPLLGNQQQGLGMLPPGLIQGQNGGVVLPPGFPNPQMGPLGHPQSNLPSALILPNGQIIPVVTQPSMLGVNNSVMPSSQGAPLMIPNSKASTLVSNTAGEIFMPGVGQIPNYLGMGSMAGPAQSYGGLLMTTQSMTTTALTTMSDQSSQTNVTPSVQATMTSTVLPSSETFQQNMATSIMTTQPTYASSLSQPHLLGQPPVGLPLPQFMVPNHMDGVIKNSAGQVIGGQGQIMVNSNQDVAQKLVNSSTGGQGLFQGQGQIIPGQGQMGVTNQGVLQPPLGGIPVMNSQGQFTISIPQTGTNKDNSGKAQPGVVTFGSGISQSVVSQTVSTGGQSKPHYTQPAVGASTSGGGILTSSSSGVVTSVSSTVSGSAAGSMPQTVQVISSNGAFYLTLPPGAQQQGPIIIDPSSLPMLQPKPTSSAGPTLAPIAPAPSGTAKGKNKKGQRVLMPKPPLNMMHPAVWPNQVFLTEKVSESNRENESLTKNDEMKEKPPETTETTDILAKAAESIFSSSMADISPMMYGSPDQDQPLQIDTAEQQPIVPKKDSSRNRNRKKKPSVPKPKVQKAYDTILSQKDAGSPLESMTLPSQIVEEAPPKTDEVVLTSGSIVNSSSVQYSTPLSIVVPESNSTPITSNSTLSSGMTSLNIPDLSSRLLSFTSSTETTTKPSESNCSTPTITSPLAETAANIVEAATDSKNSKKKPVSPIGPKEPSAKSRKRNSSKKNVCTSPKIKPSSLPETIMFSEADLSDVLDQVENLDIPNMNAAEQPKPGRSRGKRSKANDKDDSGKPEKKKRKQNSKQNDYDFQDDILPEDPGLHIDLDPPSFTESDQAHVLSPPTKVVTSAPSTPATPSIAFVSPKPVEEPTPHVVPEPEKLVIPDEDPEQHAKELLDSIEEMIQAPSSVNSTHQPSPAIMSPAVASTELPELGDVKSEDVNMMETLGLMTSIDVPQPSQMSPPKLTAIISPIRLPSPLPTKPLSETALESFPTNHGTCVTPPNTQETLQDACNDQPLGNPSLFADVPITKPIIPSPKRESSIQSPGFSGSPQISQQNNFNPYDSGMHVTPSIEMDIPRIEMKNTMNQLDRSKSLELIPPIPDTSLANEMPGNSPNEMPGNSANQMSGNSTNQLSGNAQPPFLSHSVESLFGSSGNRKESGRTPESHTQSSVPEKGPEIPEPTPAPPPPKPPAPVVPTPPAPAPAPKPPPATSRQKSPSKAHNYHQGSGNQPKKKRSSAQTSQPNFYSAENLLHSQNSGRHPLQKDMPPMFASPGSDGGVHCNMPPRGDGFNCNPLFLPPSSSGPNMPPTSMPFNMPPSSSAMQPPPFSFSLSSSSSSAPTNTFSPQSSQFSFYPLHPPISSHNSAHGPIPGPGSTDNNLGLNLPQFGMGNSEQNNSNRDIPRPNQENLTSPPGIPGNPNFPNFNRPTNNTRATVHHGPGRNQFMDPVPPLMHNEKDLGNLPPPLQQSQFNMLDSRRPDMNLPPSQTFPEMGRAPPNASESGPQRLMPDMGRHPPQFSDIPPPSRMNQSQPRHPETSPSQTNFQNHPNSGSQSQNRPEMNLPHSRQSDMSRSRRQSDGGHSRMNDMGQSPRMAEINQSPNRIPVPESSQGPKRLSELPPPLNSQPRSRSSSLTSRSPHVMNNMPGPGPFFHSPGSTFVNQGPPPPELTSPPLRHPPSRGPSDMRPSFESGNFNNQPPQDFNPMLNFGTPGFDPPALELREANHPHPQLREPNPPHPPPPTTQSSAFNSNQAPPPPAPPVSQNTKTSNARSETTRATKRTTSTKTPAASKPRSKSKKTQKQQQQQQQYEMDTNLSNSIFEPNRSMTPYFPISNMSSPPPPRNMQTDGPTYIGNLFSGPSRPLSNTGPSPHHKNPEVNAQFNAIFPPARPQNGLGLNFQPPGFGMNHMHGNHGNPGPIPPHTNSVSVTPHMPNFNLSNFFQDINNPGQNDSINISPIKFSHGNPILPPQGVDHQLQHHHQPGMFHNRPPPQVLHNAISLLGHQHHGFDSRQVGQSINSSMGPPFHGHGGAPSFGMPPGLNFNMHDH